MQPSRFEVLNLKSAKRPVFPYPYRYCFADEQIE